MELMIANCTKAEANILVSIFAILAANSIFVVLAECLFLRYPLLPNIFMTIFKPLAVDTVI